MDIVNVKSIVINNSIENLINGLLSSIEFDNDINGENGQEYEWEIALEHGYSSSLVWLETELWEYTEHTFDTIFDRFIEIVSNWGGYTIDWDIAKDENNNWLSIAICYSEY